MTETSLCLTIACITFALLLWFMIEGLVEWVVDRARYLKRMLDDRTKFN